MFLTTDLKARIDIILYEWDIPGASVAVLSSTNRLEQRLHGNLDPAITLHSLFPFASNSKLFSVVALAILVDDGKLDWNDKLVDLFGRHNVAFKLQDAQTTANMTVIDMLSHQSGVPRHDWAASQDDTLASIFHKLQHQTTAVPLRTRWLYNNIMYNVAGYLITLISGEDYRSFVSKHILTPLEMNETTFNPFTVFSQIPAATHDGLKTAFWLESAEENLLELVAPGAGIVSSMADMMKWVSHLMKLYRAASSNSAYPSNALISKEAILEITKPRFPLYSKYEELQEVAYCLGLQKAKLGGVEVFSHQGSLPSHQSIVAWLPSLQLGIIVAIACGNPFKGTPAADAIAYTVAGEIIGDSALKSINWSTRYRAEYEDHTSVTYKLCENPKPASSTFGIVGEYYSPAYGTAFVRSLEEGIHWTEAQLRDLPFDSLEEAKKQGYRFAISKPATVFHHDIIGFARHDTEDRYYVFMAQLTRMKGVLLLEKAPYFCPFWTATFGENKMEWRGNNESSVEVEDRQKQVKEAADVIFEKR